MKSLLSLLGMQGLLPLFAGAYSALLVVVFACSKGDKLPRTLVFTTAFFFAAAVSFSLFNTLPYVLDHIRGLDFSRLLVLTLLGLEGGNANTPASTTPKLDTTVLKADNPGEGQASGSGTSNVGANGSTDLSLEQEVINAKARLTTLSSSQNDKYDKLESLNARYNRAIAD